MSAETEKQIAALERWQQLESDFAEVVCFWIDGWASERGLTDDEKNALAAIVLVDLARDYEEDVQDDDYT